MGSIENSIKKLLIDAFSPSILSINNESYMHNVPKDSESHFKVVLVSDNFTGLFDYVGDSNVWDLLVNSSGTINSDYIDLNIDVTGSSNIADIKIAENADASYLNLDWIILGDSNEFDFDIDYANAINLIDINGSSNDITFTASGYGGNTSSDSGYFELDLTGSTNTINVIQSSTLARDYLKIIGNTSNSNLCIVQNDGGTTTGC